MAIDSKYLEDSPPESGAVERLRRKRIRPWESHLVPTTQADDIKADTEPTQSQHKAVSPNGNTDGVVQNGKIKEPTQSRHEAKVSGSAEFEDAASPNEEEKADTEPTQKHRTGNTDRLPPSGSGSTTLLDSETTSSASAPSFVPASEQSKPTQSRHKSVDTHGCSAEFKEDSEAARADTAPTQSRHAQRPGEAKADTEPTQALAKPTQSRHKQGITRSKADTEATPEPTQRRHRADTQSDTTFELSIEQTSLDRQLRGLSGAKLELMDFLCGYGATQRSRVVSGVTYEFLAKRSGVSLGSVRTTAKRLRDMGLIVIRPLGLGPGAKLEIEVPEAVFICGTASGSAGKGDTEPTQSRHPIRHKADTRTDTNASSSSGSDLDLITTTTNQVPMPPEWVGIDTTPLQDIHFTQTHVRQLWRAGLLSASDLQDSIDSFAFDLTANNKAKKLTGPPLNFFMGCLRRGPYAPPENYESPKARAARCRREALERELEEVRRTEEKEKELAFEKWRLSLSAEQVRQLAAKAVGPQSVRAELWNHFERNVREAAPQP